jgi:hypothetical protein
VINLLEWGIFNKEFNNGINMKTKSYIKFLTVLLSFAAFFTATDVNAEDYMISQEKMTQIEERVNNMSTNQLSNQMTSLISEAQNLQEEQ